MSDINAIVRMEEKYIKMELEYHNNDDKHKILQDGDKISLLPPVCGG